jgi:hypothetical protein
MFSRRPLVDPAFGLRPLCQQMLAALAQVELASHEADRVHTDVWCPGAGRRGILLRVQVRMPRAVHAALRERDTLHVAVLQHRTWEELEVLCWHAEWSDAPPTKPWGPVEPVKMVRAVCLGEGVAFIRQRLEDALHGARPLVPAEERELCRIARGPRRPRPLHRELAFLGLVDFVDDRGKVMGRRGAARTQLTERGRAWVKRTQA